MAAPTVDPHVRMKTGCDTDAEDDPRPLCWSLDSEGQIIAPGPNPSGWCIHDTQSKFGDQVGHVCSDHRCDGRFAPGGQLWYLLANGQLRNERTMLCSSVRYLTTGYTSEERRYVMVTDDCDATKMSQIWMYNTTSLEFSTMVEEPDGPINRRCLDSGGNFVETRTYISVNRRESRELFLSTNCGTDSRFREFYM